jgi:GT2 family glycosyltransferase
MEIKPSPYLLSACVSIPTYNREEVLVQTLKSVLSLDPFPLEVLVIDQTEEHEATTKEFLAKIERAGQIRLIRQQPPSLTAARNRAIAETRCEVIIFIDDDVELPTDFVARHMKNYSNDKTAAVAGRVEQESQPRYPHPPPGGKWSPLFDYKYFSVFSSQRVEGVASFMGCNHSVRTDILRQLGGYDTHYIGSAFREDTDMAVRIWKSGGQIVFDPEARLRHLAAPSGGCRINLSRKANPEWWVPFNRHYFAFRHLFPKWEFWKLIFFRDFRETVLRKANLLRPWRIPRAVFSYGYAVVRAWEESRRKSKE